MKQLLFLAAVVLLSAACGASTPQANPTPTPTTVPPPSPTTIPSPATASPTLPPSPTTARVTTTPALTLQPTPTAAPTTIPAQPPPTVDEFGLITYHNTDYGFSFEYPADRWTLIERPNLPNELSLAYHELGIALRLKYKRLGEGKNLQQYGGAAGDFVERGTINFLGQTVERTALAFRGADRTIFYNATNELRHDNFLISMALDSNRRHEEAILPVEVQAEADRILESFVLDDIPAVAIQPTREPLTEGPPVVFVYQSGELARTDIEGSAVEQLSPVSGVGDEPAAYFYANPPQVSPDGRWLIDESMVSETAGYWRLIDVAAREIVAVGGGQSRLSPTWSADSRAFAYLTPNGICVYSLASATEGCTPVREFDIATELLENLIGTAWSPDGRRVALAQADISGECCRGTVWLLSLADSQAFEAGVYDVPPQAGTEEMFEWLADGRLLFKSTTPDVPSILYSTTAQPSITYPQPARDISPDGRWVLYRSGEVGDISGIVAYTLPANDICPQPILTGNNWAWSPDGTRLAFLLNCAAATETSWVYVLDAATGEVQWEKTLPIPAEALYPLDRVFWSPDGTYLLLDGPDTTLEFTRPLSPVWRLAADGSGELEVLVESGYLLDVVPQWAEP